MTLAAEVELTFVGELGGSVNARRASYWSLRNAGYRAERGSRVLLSAMGLKTTSVVFGDLVEH